MNNEDKASLRKYIRMQKRHFLQHELEEMSFCISSSLMENERISHANTILLYYPLPDEVNISGVISTLYEQGKRIILPKVIDETTMSLHEYTGIDSLETGAYGIMEPTGRRIEEKEYDSIDVAVIPGMAFDDNGNRLGRGKGYYDRFLSCVPFLYTIGVCFPFQKVEKVPSLQFDIRVREVIC